MSYFRVKRRENLSGDLMDLWGISRLSVSLTAECIFLNEGIGWKEVNAIQLIRAENDCEWIRETGFCSRWSAGVSTSPEDVQSGVNFECSSDVLRFPF